MLVFKGTDLCCHVFYSILASWLCINYYISYDSSAYRWWYGDTGQV